MTYYYAQLTNDKLCHSVTEHSEPLAESENIVLLDFFDKTKVDKYYIDGEWQDPPPPEPTWLITVGALFDRFGALKYQILASTDANVKAVISDASVRQYIDLKSPSLPAGLDIIIAAGFAIDKNSIVNVPATPGEIP